MYLQDTDPRISLRPRSNRTCGRLGRGRFYSGPLYGLATQAFPGGSHREPASRAYPKNTLSKDVTILIANPAALAGKRYTSGRNALKLMRQNRACLLEDGRLFITCRFRSREPEDGQVFFWASGESGQSYARLFTKKGNGMMVKKARRGLRKSA